MDLLNHYASGRSYTPAEFVIKLSMITALCLINYISVVGMVTSVTAGQSGVRFLAGHRNFSLPQDSIWDQ
jgi:hypothetical protein